MVSIIPQQINQGKLAGDSSVRMALEIDMYLLMFLFSSSCIRGTGIKSNNEKPQGNHSLP